MRNTALKIFALGFVVGLLGDACHVASGTTHYEWDGVPAIFKSALWFPFLVGAGVLGLAVAGRESSLAPARVRTRADVPAGAAAVLAIYALTATLRGQPDTVTVILVGALGALVWAWWDPSPGAALGGAIAAISGPLVEIGVVELGAASYAPGADGLLGVAPWLTGLYFAAGAVGFRLWGALERPG